jgi:NADH-quinone oxidoreductase subunit H
VLAVLVWLRRRLPVARPDTFLEVGWLVLLPAVLLQDLVVAVVAVWRS